MTGDVALHLVAQMLWVGVQIVAPLLGVVLAVGIVISIVQVVTQIQEVSLSFIPKIVAVVLVVVLFGPWMMKRLVAYSTSVISGIPGYL
jgi:flagellar biosynthesis protein FliQ